MVPGMTLDTGIGGVLAVKTDGVLVHGNGDGVLESISVRVVTELAAKLGMKAFEWDNSPAYPTDENISEMLLAGSRFGIAGVKSYFPPEGELNFSWPGPVFAKLAAAWSDLVGVDIVKQFTG